MPLSSKLAGREIGRMSAVCDARWLMAYAAGIPDQSPELFDTANALVAHPLFPVGPEWALLVGQRSADSMMSRDELLRGVHVAHDVVHERPIVAGATIDIAARVVAVGHRASGATQRTLFEATDANGLTVWRTSYVTLFRGVELDGDPVELDIDWPELPKPSAAGASRVDSTPPIAVGTSEVRAVDAHVYSECARIWNPIHTDVATARASGLDAPILHGTATLARAVSIVAKLASVRLADVVRVAGTFASMVPLGSTITIRVLSESAGSISFDVVNEAGRRCIIDGVVATRSRDQNHRGATA